MFKTILIFAFFLFTFTFLSCSSEFTRVGNPPTMPLPNAEELTRVGNPPTNPGTLTNYLSTGKAVYFAGGTETVTDHVNYLVKLTDNGDKVTTTITSTDFPEELTVETTMGGDGVWSTEETATGVCVIGVQYDASVVDANGIVLAKLKDFSPIDPQGFLPSADTEAMCKASTVKCFDLDKGIIGFTHFYLASHVRSSIDNSVDCADMLYDTCVGPDWGTVEKSDTLAERVCVENGENGPLHHATLQVKCACENGRCTDEPSEILTLSDMMKSTKNPIDLKQHGPVKPPAVINKFMLSPPKISPEILQVIL